MSKKINWSFHQVIELWRGCCRSLLIFFLLAFTIILSTAKNGFSQEFSSLSKYDSIFSEACGPVNLYFALLLLGKEPIIEDMLDRCLETESGQTSFKYLQQMAEKHGVATLCVKMNIRALRNLQQLAILNMTKKKGNHFVLYAGWVDGKCKILDATRDKDFLQYIERDELKQIWDGNIMVLSKEPLSLSMFTNIGAGQTIGKGVLGGVAIAVIILSILKLIVWCRSQAI